MKKWYFSDNGNVTGPVSVDSATSLFANGGDLYAWNASFSQWLPVALIPELSNIIPTTKVAAQVPKGLIDKFIQKKKDLNKKVLLIEESLKATKNNMLQLERVINHYEQLTSALTTEIQCNIEPINRKHATMSKQFNELMRAVDIAKQEIIDVVKEFGELVLSKVSKTKELDLYAEDLPEMHQRNESLQIESIPINPFVKGSVEVFNCNTEGSVDSTLLTESLVVDNQVFANPKSEVKLKAEVTPLKKPLEQQIQKPDEELVFIDVEVADNVEILTEAPKKKRRRRRRF